MAIFRWDDAQLTSLINLLAMRSSTELDPNMDGSLKDEDEVIEQTEDDAKTSSPALISGIDPGDVKRKFLDRLAEVLSKDKGGTHVSCAVLKEESGSITVFASRNSAFDKVDQRFCDTFQELLMNISISIKSGEDAKSHKQELWKKMVEYNEPRLEYYIHSLQANLKTLKTHFPRGFLPDSRPNSIYPLVSEDSFCDDERIGPYSEETRGKYMQFAWEKIMELDAILSLSQPHSTRRCSLVEKAYDLRHLKSLKMLMAAYFPDLLYRKLLSDILFLGRIRSAFITFVDAVERIPSFCSLAIVLIHTPPRLSSRPKNLPLSEALGLIRLPANDATIRNHIQPKLSLAKSEKIYKAFNAKPLHTHAEIQLILHFSGREVTDGIFPYMGCSKLSCFLCTTFLKSYTRLRFSTRGSHGKLYTQWCISDCEGLKEDAVGELYESLKKMRNILVRELCKPIVPKPAMAESSAGYTVTDAPISPLARDMLQQMRSRESGLNCIFKPYPLVDWQPISSGHEPSVQELSGSCMQCERETSRKCSRCSGSWFCSKSCERDAEDWTSHKFKCSIGRPLDTADYLQRACISDSMPEDEDVLHDFRFSKFCSGTDKSRLLGLYQGLLYYIPEPVSSRDLHDWQIKGTLTEHIIAKYETIPAHARGEYFPWFLRNLNQFNKADDTDKSDFFAPVLPYLDVTDRKNAGNFQPKSKQDSFALYSLLLQDYHPDPSTQLYKNFGFCTGSGLAAERILPQLYKQLISKCTFTEFWTSYQSNNLLTLLEAKGIKKHQWPEHFETFMTNYFAHGWCWSVWDLKIFLLGKETDPPRSVSVDYGFIHCDIPQMVALKGIYERLLYNILLPADPMDLHQACIEGRLYDFASGYLGELDSMYRILMKNPYPLPEH